MISTLAVYNYRSRRDFVVPLQALNVITGPNGSGKSNVYRALRLLADIAQGRIIPSHAARLIAALEEQPGCQSLTLEKALGETALAGAGRLDKPRWEWPKR